MAQMKRILGHTHRVWTLPYCHRGTGEGQERASPGQVGQWGHTGSGDLAGRRVGTD